MKYTGSYFPFIIISLLLYGLFFYSHTRSPIEEKIELSSTKEITQVQSNVTQRAVSAAEKTQTPPTISAEEAQIQLLNNAVAIERNKLDVQRKAELQIAKEQYLESLAKHNASDDALLKGQIFNDELAAQRQAAKERAAQKRKNQRESWKIARQEAAATTSIASILPITDPVPDTQKSPVKFIPKEPIAIAPAPKQTIKPKFTLKTPKKVSSNTSEVTTRKATPTETTVDAVKTVPAEKQTTEKAKRTFRPTPIKTSSENNSDNNGSSAASEGGTLQDAVAVSGKKPNYPEEAILNKQEGRVLVKMTVMVNGKTKQATIVKSSGHSILDAEVLNFVSYERFMPALKGQDKVASEQLFSFQFELN